jgi:YkoP domain
VSVELSARRGSGLPWLEHAIFALDGWLRRRQGIYEFTRDPSCMFRVGLRCADQTLRLSDGTLVRAGDPVLELHLWNENIPAMGLDGPTVAWAHQVSRAIHSSLRALADYLDRQPALDGVKAVCGDMQLGSPRQTEQLAHIVARYGFEAVDDKCGRRGTLHRFGKSLLIFLLVMATNPIALRSAILRPYHKRVFLSRSTLERRYRT